LKMAEHLFAMCLLFELDDVIMMLLLHHCIKSVQFLNYLTIY